MGFRKFSLLAVAAAIIVVAALFVLMLKGFGTRGNPDGLKENPASEENETEVPPSDEPESLKEAGVRSEHSLKSGAEEGPGKDEEDD